VWSCVPGDGVSSSRRRGSYPSAVYRKRCCCRSLKEALMSPTCPKMRFALSVHRNGPVKPPRGNTASAAPNMAAAGTAQTGHYPLRQLLRRSVHKSDNGERVQHLVVCDIGLTSDATRISHISFKVIFTLPALPARPRSTRSAICTGNPNPLFRMFAAFCGH
jgi:hypothetical protein